MKIKSQIIESLKKKMEELIPIRGLRFYFEPQSSLGENWHPDFIAQVSFKNKQFKILGVLIYQQGLSVFKEKMSLLKLHASHDRDSVPMIVAQYLSPEKRKQCQNAGVNFLDLCGNIFLEYDSLYIERIGFPNRFPEKKRGRRPFSDKASLILRAIFSNKEKLWGVRELAQSVGLDPGFVSRMARELETRNYVSRVDYKLKLRDPKSILEDWVREYDYKKNQEVRYFCLGKSPNEIIDKVNDANVPEKIQYAFGLHAGSNLVSPYAVYNEVHIYVSSQDTVDWFTDKLKLKEAQEGANFVFLLPYYKHSVFYDRQNIRSLWVVSDLQLYLDLYNYPIRGLEQAEHLYEKRLRKIIES